MIKRSSYLWLYLEWMKTNQGVFWKEGWVFTHPSCFYWQYKFIKMSRNYFINVSIVSLCSIYQTIALIRDFNIDLQWGRYYVSLLLFFFIKKRILEWRRCHFLLNANLIEFISNNWLKRSLTYLCGLKSSIDVLRQDSPPS